MEINQKLEKLTKIFHNAELIEFDNEWKDALKCENRIKAKQIFVEFNIDNSSESKSSLFLQEQLEIAIQLLLNKGYTFVIFCSDYRQIDDCKKFTSVFKSDSIVFVEQNKDQNFTAQNLLESEIAIVMSEEYLLKTLFLEKPFLALQINDDISNSLVEIGEILIVSLSELNAGVLVQRIEYLLKNWEYKKNELLKIFNQEGDEFVKSDDETNLENSSDILLDTEKLSEQTIVEQNEFVSNQLKLKQNIKILIEQGFLAEAKESISQYEKIVPEDIESYSIKGVIAIMEGDLDEAEIILSDGLIIDANHFDLNYNMGYVYSLKEKNQEAFYYYKNALQSAKDSVDVKDVQARLDSLNYNKEDNNTTEIIEYTQSENDKQTDENVIIINTDNMKAPEAGDDLSISRENVYNNYLDVNAKTATIVIQAFNRLEKTKYCVECVLKYTKDIDYELILIDNGSSDGTYEFFKSVKYEFKKVIRITKNIGSGFGLLKYVYNNYRGKYLVTLPNDAYVTTNWLNNLLKCLESDNKIGWVMPMSSNISNLQDPGLTFSTLEEMQQKARDFNISDPSKWHRRLRLINILTIFKREVIDLVGKFDVGFFHDFGEDDYSIRLRQMGYKLILCGDTFVHHDHDFRNLEEKNPQIYHESLRKGRENYRNKHYGLDAWDDVNNFEINLINLLPLPKKVNKMVNILGIDVRCGTPILEIENHLTTNGIKRYKASAFTTEAKYYHCLKTLCEGDVACDRIEFINEYFGEGYYDYVILGECLNKYLYPLKLLNTIMSVAKKNSKILFKIGNNNDINKLLEILEFKNQTNEELEISISIDKITKLISSYKRTEIKIATEQYKIDSENKKKLIEMIQSISIKNNADLMKNILTKEYLVCVEKI